MPPGRPTSVNSSSISGWRSSSSSADRRDRRLEHAIAELAQDVRSNVRGRRRRPRPPGSSRLGRRLRGDWASPTARAPPVAVGEQARQVDLHRRALAGLAVDLHVAAGLLDEAVDLREAEAGALADILGGEERLEGAGRIIARLMPTPVSVIDTTHILPGRDLGLRSGIGLVEIGIGGLDRELAAVRHRVAGVDREVQDRALELVGIGEAAPQAARQHGLDRDLLAERAAQQLRHAGDQPVDVDRPRARAAGGARRRAGAGSARPRARRRAWRCRPSARSRARSIAARLELALQRSRGCR